MNYGAPGIPVNERLRQLETIRDGFQREGKISKAQKYQEKIDKIKNSKRRKKTPLSTLERYLKNE